MKKAITADTYKPGERSECEKPVKKDSFTKVTVVQLTLCLILTIIVIVISKADAQGKQRLMNDYSLLMSHSIEGIEVENVVSLIKEYLSTPAQLLPAFSPQDDETTAPVKENQTELQTETTQALSETENENEEAELSENEDGAGGEDLEPLKATENTSFSPVAVTDAILSPLDSKRYTSYFGYRINPITNVFSFHTGLDIAASTGTKIRAAYNGKVRKVGEDSRSGKYIFLTHSDGFETFYCHCSKIIAEEGAVLRQGETIALVGSTGWATGPHLHFEVRKDGTRLNPLLLLEKNDS